MNKIIPIILAIVLLLFSCSEDTINIDPVGDTESGFFQNEVHMQMAVFGVYQKLAFFYAFRGGQNNHVLPVTLLPSDDLSTLAADPFESFVSLNGATAHVGLYYQFAYQLITRANTVLQKIAENGDAAYANNPELRDYHKGEALFLRAYMYFALWNVFGTAPLVTERILSLDNAYPPNSSGTQLLDQAIIDLEAATNLLPNEWPAQFRGRVVKNSARGLRGKLLVFRGTVNNANADFTAAITDFNAISGVTLTPQYSANFDATQENNVESLFEYQANTSVGNVNPFVGAAGGNDAFAAIGEIGHYTGSFNQLPTWIGNSYFSATNSIIAAYEEGDPRKSYNIDYTSGNPINVRKYVTHNAYAATGEANGISVNNPRILRYADILLLKAEALVRGGGSLAEAIGLINQVRERARNSAAGGTPSAIPANRDASESNRNTVLEWVFQERRLELAFEEGHRWWDLRRRHIAGEINLTTHDFSSSRTDLQFAAHNINFPLPFSEVDQNSNLNQNTGY